MAYVEIKPENAFHNLLGNSMYDRAPRVVSQTVGSTTGHVGPGTYDGFVGDHKKLRTGRLIISIGKKQKIDFFLCSCSVK